MKRRAVAYGWLALLVPSVAIGAALADTPKPPAPKESDELHGAAPMREQLEALPKLSPSPAGKTPPGVDSIMWDAFVPKDNPMTEKRVELGKRLYFETKLSKDGTVSCATCHDVTRSFTDRRPVSEGVGGALGRRNAPTTMNAALLQVQFWDGRASDLEDQAGQPILNPVEMALSTEEEAVQLLKDAGYDPAFEEAYGSSVNYADIERALAAFERTLIFLDAPFDLYLAGDTNAISADARQGFELFNGKGRCGACHMINRANPLGTDSRFHNIGVSARHQDFEKLARTALVALQGDSSEEKLDELAVATDLSELGRFMVTKNYADVGAFRTTQLRNTGITAPYMHDGSMQTLWDTIDHYNKGGEPNAYLDGGIEPLALTEKEIDQLVAFLFTLTDRRFEGLNQQEMERQRAIAAKERPFRDEDMAQRRVLPFEQRALGHKLGAGDQ